MQNNLHAFDHGGLAADVYSLETENSGIYVYEICFRAAQSPALLEWEMPMLDIAGLCGVFLGGAKYHMPIVADGVISAVAALTAAEWIEVSKPTGTRR